MIQATCTLIESGIPLKPTAACGDEYPDWTQKRNEALATARAPVLQWRYNDTRTNDDPP